MRLPTIAVLVLAAARWTAAASVAYRADDALFAAHVETQVLSGNVAVYAVEKEKRYSEEKTAYLVYFAANTKKEGPWESSAFIVGPPGAAREARARPRQAQAA